MTFFAAVGRILKARWLIVLLTFLSVLAGGALAAFTNPPRYAGSARVELNLLKAARAGAANVGDDDFAGAYIGTQVGLIRDYQVTGRVVDELGWSTNPELIAQAGARAKDGQAVDTRRWLAGVLASRINVSLVPDTNILEIKYLSSSKDEATAVVETIRRNYLSVLQEQSRSSGHGAAEWYDARAKQLQTRLAELEKVKTDYERQTGLVLPDEQTDVESSRLRSLAETVDSHLKGGVASSRLSPAVLQLIQLDSQISEMTRALGPRNPQVIQLQQRRAIIAATADLEKSALDSKSADSANKSQIAIELLNAQKEKVVGHRGEMANLMQMMANIKMVRAQFDEANARAAEQRKQGELGGMDIVASGDAKPAERPDFPNLPLIFGALTVLGAMLGVLIGLIVELLGRRVRGAPDIRAVGDVPLLAVVPKAATVRAPAPRKPERRRRVAAGRQVLKDA